jgi:hypothetical protein
MKIEGVVEMKGRNKDRNKINEDKRNDHGAVLSRIIAFSGLC